jgi:hypothetical protein
LLGGLPAAPDIAERGLQIWNDICGAVCPKATKCDGMRRTKLRKRIADDLRGDLEAWRAFCSRIAAAPHLRGENDRGWRADLDWVIEPANFQRISEGRYDPRGRPAASPELWNGKPITAWNRPPSDPIRNGF